jgi:hypothetical protein
VRTPVLECLASVVSGEVDRSPPPGGERTGQPPPTGALGWDVRLAFAPAPIHLRPGPARPGAGPFAPSLAWATWRRALLLVPLATAATADHTPCRRRIAAGERACCSGDGRSG